eukprot:1148755-Pelagomonas_calceolata.AAC.6
MLTSNSELVRKVLKADRVLSAAPGVKCWTAEILESFNGWRSMSRCGGIRTMLSQEGTAICGPLTINASSQTRISLGASRFYSSEVQNRGTSISWRSNTVKTPGPRISWRPPSNSTATSE